MRFYLGCFRHLFKSLAEKTLLKSEQLASKQNRPNRLETCNDPFKQITYVT